MLPRKPGKVYKRMRQGRSTGAPTKAQEARFAAIKEHGCIANRPAEHLNIIETETEDGPAVAQVVGRQVGSAAKETDPDRRSGDQHC